MALRRRSESDDLGGIGPEIRDGHNLVVSLSANYGIHVDVVCPQDDERQCKWQNTDHVAAHGPCWLRYLVGDVGGEFLEWWTDGGPSRVTLDGPIEIEWWVEGGDEPEVWWRPVVTAASEGIQNPHGKVENDGHAGS